MLPPEMKIPVENDFVSNDNHKPTMQTKKEPEKKNLAEP